ncbi:MAG: hypothetical protein GY898_20290 [Proteobacteria bacterium]|nr:hypothetical protein [Pseudomonadota bacterium]
MISTAHADSLEVEAAFDDVAWTVAGTLAWTVGNPTDAPLEHVELFLYPEIYAEDPDLDDILMPRVYPFAFSAGGQTLDCAHERLDVDVPIARIALPAALPPGGSTTVECGFTTTLPNKYGSFGHTARTVSMNGGASPLPVTLTAAEGWIHDAPPPLIDQTLELTLPAGWGGTVGGTLVGQAKERPVVAPAKSRPGPRRWLSVGLVRGMEHQNLALEDGETLTWVGRPLKKLQRRWVTRAAEEVRRMRPSDRGVVLIEAPLRRNLIEVGDGVLFVSDRFLEANTLFWRYHDLHFARGLLADSILDQVDAREHPRHAPTTLDGIAWELIPGYLAARWRNHQNLEALLQRVRFLPAVDTLLETPVFPFADQIFDNPWVVDPIRADVRRFNRPLRSGRVLFYKLEDLVGGDSVLAAATDYLDGGGDGDFHDLLSARTGRDTRSAAAEWLGPPSRQNLRVESVLRTRDEEGFHLTAVTVRRDVLDGTVTDNESVEVRVDGPAPRKRRGRLTLRWEGSEAVASWEVKTAGRTGAVTIDPRGRVLEVDSHGIGIKRDNRSPGAVRVTGYAYFLALGGGTGLDLSAYAAVNFRPKYDTRHHVLLRAFTDPEVLVGAGLSYVHYFGPQRLGSYRRHRVVSSVDIDYLNPFFRETDDPLVLELRGSYIWESRAGGFFPTRGGRFAVSLFAGKDIALKDDANRPIQEAGYAGVDVTAIRMFRLHPWHVLAVRGKVGVLAGTVEHRQFTLGGVNDLRGIPTNHTLGSFRASATVEWRHFFVRDANVQMILSRFRGLQGSLFVEAGVVAADPSTPPGADDVGVSIGYGIRIFGDWFGVLPAIGGIDFAWSPNVPEGRLPLLGALEGVPRVPFQVYLVGSQSF